MRTGLLWMARNTWMKEHLPKLPFAQKAVRRFMPGEDVEDAIEAADRLDAEGFGILFTHLGENINDRSEADAVAADYHDLLERSAARVAEGHRPIEVSVKPTQLGLDVDEQLCDEHCISLAKHAQESGTWFWLDMEGSAYTERTVALYERLKRDHPRIGIAIQSYLKRSAEDIERLLPLEPAVRLVKGAYDEPAEIAHRDRTEVDASYLSLAIRLAAAAGEGHARLCLGTHDTKLIARISAAVEPTGVPRSAIEVHMLYGIRTDELARLRDEGYPCSSLIAYGEFWYAWYMRRLAERPANVVFALRQLVP
jgi:proline dehydrogenase